MCIWFQCSGVVKDKFWGISRWKHGIEGENGVKGTEGVSET